MRLIHFSHAKEAADTLAMLQAERMGRDLYESSLGRILISGMGMERTRKALTRLKEPFSEIWNFGCVGALRDLPLGSVAKVRTVSDGAEWIDIGEEGWNLYTSPSPIHNRIRRAELAQHWDVVDMEGFVVAQYAEQRKIPCRMCKVVSDFASEGGKTLIRQQMKGVSEQLARQLQTWSPT